MFQNLIPQDSGQLSEGFKVGNMDDKGAKAVIENEAETFKELSKSWAALIFIVKATKQSNKFNPGYTFNTIEPT